MLLKQFSRILSVITTIVIIFLIIASFLSRQKHHNEDSVSDNQKNELSMKIILFQDFFTDSVLSPNKLIKNSFITNILKQLNNKNSKIEILDKLEQSYQKHPENDEICLKIIILKYSLGQNYNKYLNYLKLSQTSQYKYLSCLISNKNKVTTLKNKLQNINYIKSNIKNLWYQKELVFMQAGNCNDVILLKSYQEELRHNIVNESIKIVVACILILIITIIGLITILVFLSNQSAKQQLPMIYNIQALKSFTFFEVLIVFQFWIGCQMLIGLIVQYVNHLENNSEDLMTLSVSTLTTYFLGNIIPFGFIYKLAKSKKYTFAQIVNLSLGNEKYSLLQLLLRGFLGWCVALPVIILSSILVNQFYHSKGSSNPIISYMVDASGQSNVIALIILFITVSILAPLCEEILFRGFLFRFLITKYNFISASMISTLLFAGLHLDPNSSVQLFALGFIFTILTAKYQSIVPSIITHGLWNGFTLIIVYTIFS